MMRLSIRLASVVAAFALLGVSVAHASDWPQTGYDGGHSTFNRSETLLTRRSVASLGVSWRRSMRPADRDTYGYEYATRVDVVRGGRVFASWHADDLSRLAGLRESDGHVLWRRSFDGEWARIVAVTRTTGIAQAGRRVIEFDPATGATRWARARWRAGSVDLRDGLVLGRSGRSRNLEALDIRRGDVRWSRTMSGASDPLVSGQRPRDRTRDERSAARGPRSARRAGPVAASGGR